MVNKTNLETSSGCIPNAERYLLKGMEEMKNEPAFPQLGIQGSTVTISNGMTLRDYFAGQAMIPLIERYIQSADYILIEKHAYEIADKMLAERCKNE